MECDHCGRNLSGLDYTCSKCGETFCTKCRLPESHDCIGLKVEKAERQLKREEGETEAWFKNNEAASKGSDEKTISGSYINKKYISLLLVIAVFLLAGIVLIFT